MQSVEKNCERTVSLCVRGGAMGSCGIFCVHVFEEMGVTVILSASVWWSFGGRFVFKSAECSACFVCVHDREVTTQSSCSAWSHQGTDTGA